MGAAIITQSTRGQRQRRAEGRKVEQMGVGGIVGESQFRNLQTSNHTVSTIHAISESIQGQASGSDLALIVKITLTSIYNPPDKPNSDNHTDTGIKRTIENSKKPSKRGRDGVKNISADGVTAVAWHVAFNGVAKKVNKLAW